MIWRLIIRATGDQTESDGSGRVLYENLENPLKNLDKT